jgi:SAM-dependent methyltransferase
MFIDVVDLRNFYSQALGIVARRFVGRGIRAQWGDLRQQRVAGIGYPTPYLGIFREEAERCLAFMPASQGVVKWPSNRPGLAALVDETGLPLTDSAVDRVLLVHAIEMAEDPVTLLREVWRVLTPNGRILAVVPNRRGLWARTDTTPFGHGRPYSRPQITRILRETLFAPARWSEALYVPPVPRAWFLRSAGVWERTGATLSAPFAGVHIVEASKQAFRAIPVRREKRQIVPSLKPVLAPSPGGAARVPKQALAQMPD